MTPAEGGQNPSEEPQGIFPLCNTRENAQILRFGGIDRISVVVQADTIFDDFEGWKQFSTARTDEGEVFSSVGFLPLSEGHSVHVSARWSDSVLPSIRLDWNPSRHFDPEGFSLASVASTAESASEVLSLLDDFAGGLQTASETARVTRLDVAQDFDLGESVSPFLKSLAHAHRRYATLNHYFTDANSNKAQTFIAGNKSGLIRCYDKHAESEVAPEGTVRVEVQSRRDWLKRFAEIRSLADVSESKVARLAHNRFEWSKCGVEVVSRKALQDKISALPLSASRRSTLYAFVVAQSLGEQLNLSANTTRLYRRLQVEHGLLVSADDEPTTPNSLRLDWSSGQVVRG
jgi:hypothetical protein